MGMLPNELLFMVAKYCDIDAFINIQKALSCRIKPNKLPKSRGTILKFPKIETAIDEWPCVIYDHHRRPHTFWAKTYYFQMDFIVKAGSRKSEIFHRKVVRFDHDIKDAEVKYYFCKQRIGTRRLHIYKYYAR
jgi:hypothetical protein